MTVAGTSIRPRRDLASSLKAITADATETDHNAEEIGSSEPSIDDLLADRPQTRADCKDVPRPCPYVGCRYHVYLEVSRTGRSIRLLHPEREVWEIPADRSCVLDVIDGAQKSSSAHHVTVGRVAEVLGISIDRAAQIQKSALVKYSKHGKLLLQIRAAEDDGCYRVHLPTYPEESDR